jgi:lysophospholipase L1-like esterase
MFKLAPYDVDSPFAEELRVFMEADAAGTVPQGAVVFCGGSSIRLWTSLTIDFPEWTVINRGFGGSTLKESLTEMDWMILPLQPRAIVLYAGDNDLEQGASPEQVLGRFEQFIQRVRERLDPQVPVLFLSIKPSPARMGNIGSISHTNALLRAAITNLPRVRFVDVFSAMLDRGKPRMELFDRDWLHLSAAGYALWAKAVREAFAEPGLLP